jgi:hypothetical protein
MLKILKDNDSLWVNGAFYSFSALLIAVIFSYAIIALKSNIQKQKIAEIEKNIVGYEISQDSANIKKIIDYKKRIDDYGLILNNHKVYSKTLVFIEENTLPNVWFSSFDASQSKNSLKLSGETENMETLSHQVSVFEDNQDYVKSANIVNSQIEPSGKIKFVMNLYFNPKIFAYTP